MTEWAFSSATLCWLRVREDSLIPSFARRKACRDRVSDLKINADKRRPDTIGDSERRQVKLHSLKLGEAEFGPEPASVVLDGSHAGHAFYGLMSPVALAPPEVPSISAGESWHLAGDGNSVKFPHPLALVWKFPISRLGQVPTSGLPTTRPKSTEITIFNEQTDRPLSLAATITRARRTEPGLSSSAQGRGGGG
jgi:hypothetical protein